MPPRFGDMDPLRHLNNAALARFYEDGRVRFIDAIGGRAAVEPGYGFVVAEVTIQYLAEGRYPDVVTVSSGLLRLGRSSCAMAHALFQGGACIGTSETTLVHVKRRESGSRPLPDALRTVLRAYTLTGPPGATSTGSNRFPVDMPRYVDFYMQGRLKLDEMVSARLPLERVNDAFEEMKRGEVARSVIVFDA